MGTQIALAIDSENFPATLTHVYDGSKDASSSLVEKLQNKFDGKIVWYMVSVKLDLEARHIIERIPKTTPHKLKGPEITNFTRLFFNLNQKFNDASNFFL